MTIVRLLITVDKTQDLLTLIDNCQTEARVTRLLRDVCKENEQSFKFISLTLRHQQITSYKYDYDTCYQYR